MRNKFSVKYILLLLILVAFKTSSQTKITIDASVTYQTIQGFGASDAWNTDFVGRYWSNEVKEDIAKKLFAQTFDQDGNPEGIGLSRWRFNIGAGSFEQGDNSNIEHTERRVECFLNENGTYNWTKQSGQQWFLKQAKTYGVENLVAFVNSPPRFYTINGRTNSDNTNRYGNTNLKDGYYDDFANFLSTVLKHFSDEDLAFSQISPVNEPQYAWRDGQEGCPWKNEEIKELVGELNTAIIDNDLSTKILVAEAASYKDLYENNNDADKSNQFANFFNSSNANYLGDYTQVIKGLSGHSYWTDYDDATIRSSRESVYNKSQEIGVELHQTEYNLLSADYNDPLINSIFLAKMIYADLAISGACTWDYWTAIERERWDQRNRFYLIRLHPSGGDYGELNAGGTITPDKNLWVIGNYSLFVRPGYKRINITGADNLARLMGTAFISPDETKIVAVYVNWGTSSKTIEQNLENLPLDSKIKSIKSYLTNANNDLKVKNEPLENSFFKIPARSVTTIVLDFGNSSAIKEQNQDETEIDYYPNPTKGVFYLKASNTAQKNQPTRIINVMGETIYSNQLNLSQDQMIDITNNPPGLYILQTPKGTYPILKQ